VLAEQLANSIQSIDIVLTGIQYQIETLSAQSPNNVDSIFRGESTHQFLMERLPHLKQAELVGLMDKNGRLVNTTQQWPSPDIDLPIATALSTSKTMTTKYLYQQYRGRTHQGMQVVFFSKRINGNNDTFLGVAVVGVKLDYFQHIYQSIASLRDQSFLLLHRDGTVILRYPDATIRAGEKMPTGSPWHRLVLQGGGQYRSPGYFDGEARLVAVRPLRDYPLSSMSLFRKTRR